MKYKLKVTSQFKKDYKRVKKRGLDTNELKAVIEILVEGNPLPDKYLDHELKGNWKGFRECHIKPDWLLIYYLDNDVLVLTLTRTGSHSELFSK